MKHDLETIGHVLAALEIPAWEHIIAEVREAGQSLWDSRETDAGAAMVTITLQRDGLYDLELASYVPAAEMTTVAA